MSAGPTFIVTCAVDDDGKTHTKVNLTGYTIVQAEALLVKAINALKEEHWAMIEHHFPHKIPDLPRSAHLHQGMVIQVRHENPAWEPHTTSVNAQQGEGS